MRVTALFLCVGFVFYLFLRDRRRGENGSPGLWIPLVWMFFAGSRFLSHWLSFGGASGTDNIGDGSPLDRALFLALIVAAVAVLRSRRISWSRVLFENKWIWLYFVLGIVSLLWSAYPAVSFKRLVKAIGNVAMSLVILTEERPYEACVIVLKRLAYLTLPLSVVFIKYFPDLGRAYHANGVAMYTGVGMQKNSLGQLCMLGAICCVWRLLYHPEPDRRASDASPLIRLEYVMLALVVWLMSMADSATSLGCLAAGVGLLFVGKLRVANTPRRLVSLAAALLVIVIAFDSALDVTGAAIETLGRARDLTTRVPMWEDLLKRVSSPIFGPGFEIYWLTDAGLQSLKRWQVGHAHNGYIETYLSLGLVGLIIQLAGIISAFPSIAQHSKADFPGAALRLTLVMVVILYNWTEATFRSVSNTWLLFFVASLDVSVANRFATTRVVLPRTHKSRMFQHDRPAAAVVQADIAGHSGASLPTVSPVAEAGSGRAWHVRRRLLRAPMDGGGPTRRRERTS